MSRFLWKGPSMDKHGSKVVWSKICLPFAEGGLAIKNLTDWNKSLILMHLWHVINPLSPSLWAKWVHKTLLKSKSFWAIPIPPDCSWIWRKVLQCRDIARRHISFDIGNGANTSLWFDPWIGQSPLANSVHSSLIVNYGLGPYACVNSIIHNSRWVLPASNHQDVIDFRNCFDYLRPCNSANRDDIFWDGINDVKVLPSRILFG